MPYYTLHRHKGIHHYVHVGVLSDSSFYRMSYYTLHRHMGTHPYVHDVLADCSFYRMPCYTLHMNVDAHTPECHRNIYIQHCVHEVVHSEYPSKNIKVKN
jgi:hypothetical protein